MKLKHQTHPPTGKRTLAVLALALGTCLAPLPAAAALPERQLISVDQQLDRMLDDVEAEAIRFPEAKRINLRGITIPLQSVIEDKILSANRRVVLRPRQIVLAIEEELGRGADRAMIADRLVRDFLDGRYDAR